MKVKIGASVILALIVGFTILGIGMVPILRKTSRFVKAKAKMDSIRTYEEATGEVILKEGFEDGGASE